MFKKLSKAEKAQRALNLFQGEMELEELVAFDYRVVQYSEYHFRINNRLDVWPSSKKWYDQKTLRKGEYENLSKFVKEFIPLPPKNTK